MLPYKTLFLKKSKNGQASAIVYFLIMDRIWRTGDRKYLIKSGLLVILSA